MDYKSYWKNRGNPWEYDAGPAKNLSWARLFAETPNYRQLSKTLLKREKFRWHFGPMFYRGRLKKNSVKVLIIGQEGAQDESLSHHSFTGGTGARMQHFLHTIGINHSYLFVNTFVYPIFGQYDSKVRWLAQNPDSPIVQHRHDIFNYIVKKNDVQLIVAVGKAAKESLQTWIESRGGSCPDGSRDVFTCTAHVLGGNTKTVGVKHPGGAANGGAISSIKQSFQTAIEQIKAWADADPTWLSVDDEASRDLSQPYVYSRAPIPFKDLPFGITWRLGRGGTSSNRKDRQRSIQLFSKGGKYGNKGDKPHYKKIQNSDDDGYVEQSGDVPYEPNVHDYKHYDKGPKKGLAKLLMGGKESFEWPNFQDLGVTSHESLGYGSIYRGRPKKARILIIADQECHTDLFTCRALTGNAGQHLQAYLRCIGITKSYCIIRSLPVDSLDLDISKRIEIASDPQIQKVYAAIIKKILRKNKTELILTVGDIAKTLLQKVNTGIDIIELTSWSEANALNNWQQALPEIQAKQYTKDNNNPNFNYNGEREQIPTFDLPYGTLKWQASSGDRGIRATLPNGEYSPDYYKFVMPRWAFNLKPVALSEDEQATVDKHL